MRTRGLPKELICNSDGRTEIEECTGKFEMQSLHCSPQFQATFTGEGNLLYYGIPGLGGLSDIT